MKTNKIMGYDQTKEMLKKLRSLNENVKPTVRVIKEDDTEGSDDIQTKKQLEDVTVINDVEVNMLSTDKDDMGLKEDQKKAISQLIDNFRQQVSQIVDFDPGMTIGEKQIRLDGTLSDQDVNFVLIAGEESGLYINGDMLKIEDDVMEVIEKLSKFQETFRTALEPIITNRSNN